MTKEQGEKVDCLKGLRKTCTPHSPSFFTELTCISKAASAPLSGRWESYPPRHQMGTAISCTQCGDLNTEEAYDSWTRERQENRVLTLAGGNELTCQAYSQRVPVNKQQVEQLPDHCFLWGFISFETHGGNQVYEEAIAHLTELGIPLYCNTKETVGKEITRIARQLQNQLNCMALLHGPD